jgi:hypothetical protein
VAVDANGTLYVADVATNQVLQIDRFGTVLARLTGALNVPFSQPISVALDGPDVYVTDYVNGRVLKLTPDPDQDATLGSNLDHPDAIAIYGGYAYVATFYGNTLEKIALDGSSQETLASGLSGPSAVAILPVRNAIYIGNLYTEAVLFLPLDTTGTSTNHASISLPAQFIHPCGLAVDAAGDVDVSDCSTNAIYQYQRSLGGTKIPARHNTTGMR